MSGTLGHVTAGTYQRGVAGTIRQLQKTLSLYPLGAGGITVVKELVQNADDAGAPELHLVICSTGLPGAENSLLQGPALLVYNNGPFRAVHRDGLTTSDETSKSQDSTAIGRFGIGQQSVFHLCESWFYVGRSEEGLIGGVLDPWTDPRAAGGPGDRDHPDWARFGSSDQARVLKALGPRASAPGWLALWLPLRQQEHRRKTGGFITEQIWTVGRLAAELADLSSIVEMMPQLKALESVELSQAEEAGAGERSLVRVHVSLGSARVSRPKLDDRSVKAGGGGEIVLTCREVTTRYRYVLHERLFVDPLLSLLRGHPRWPTVPIEDGDGQREVPEKAVPHGAVTIFRGPPAEGVASWPAAGVAAGWAAYLPIGELRSGEVPSPQTVAWSIRLHGSFFPDEGRRHLLGSDWRGIEGAREADLSPGGAAPYAGDHSLGDWFRVQWNNRLRDHVLSGLLSALADGLASGSGSVEESEAVLVGLAGSPLVKSYSTAIGAAHQLLVVVEKTGAVVRLRPAHAVVLPIPRARLGSPTWTRVVLRVLAGLESFEPAVDLTFSDAPCIGGGPTLRHWTAPLLTAALSEAVLTEVGLSTEAMNWVAALLELVAERHPEVAASAAARWLRLAVTGTRLGEGQLRHASVVDAWARIARMVPSNQRFETAAHAAIATVAGCFANVVVIPVGLRPDRFDSPSRRMWEEPEWKAALGLLSDAVTTAEERGEDALVATYGQLAGEIIAALGAASRVVEDPALSALRLFRVHSSRHGRRRTVSAQVVLKAKARGMAFGGLEFDWRGRCNLLFAAIAESDHDVVYLEDEAVAEALSVPLPRGMHLLACFAYEDGPLAVGSAGVRGDLLDVVLTDPVLKSLMAPGSGQDAGHQNFRAAVRFVLTGEERSRTRRTQDLWSRESTFKLSEHICRAILGLTARDWALLPAGVDGKLTTAWKEQLRVRTLRDDILMPALREADDAGLATVCDELAEDELRGLGAFAGGDRPLWMRLPIHPCRGGKRVAAAASVYIESANFTIPKVLLDGVNVLSTPPDAWTRLYVSEWTAADQLARGLGLARQGAAANRDVALALALAILDALGELPAAQGAASASVAWLPTCEGRVVRPEDVLRLPLDVAAAVRGVDLGDEESFVLPDEIDGRCTEHAAFPRVAALGAQDLGGALDGLGMRLAVLPATARAGFWLADRPDRLPPWEALRGSQGAVAHPGLRLLQAIVVAMDGASLRGEVPESLQLAFCGELTSELLRALLQALSTAAQRAGAGSNDDTRLLIEYLRFLRPDKVDDAFRNAALTGVPLRSRSGHWRKSEELSVVANIGDGYRLDAEMSDALSLHLGHVDAPHTAGGLGRDGPRASDMAGADAALEGHFTGWLLAQVPPAALGVLAAVLGDGPSGAMRALAARWLGRFRTVESIRDDLHFDWIRVASTSDERHFLRMEEAQLGVRTVADGEGVTVPSLVGDLMRARVGGGMGGQDMLAEGVRNTSECQWLSLRLIDPARLTRQELLAVLRRSIERVLLGLTGHRPGPQLAAIWREFEVGAENQVEVARTRIRRELVWQLGQLGCSGDDPDALGLVSAVRAVQDSQQRLDELAALREQQPDRQGDREYHREPAEKQDRLARSALEKLVEHDEATRRYLLSRVRLQLSQAQYEVARVPFELFQNADDAVAQLERMLSAEGQPLPEGAREFVIECAPAAARLVRVWHWGRLINEHVLGPGFKEGRALGYDRDLANMLLLHHSDKVDQRNVTGRFGLGFKAVHLACSAPHVQSGATAFEIRGGFFPVGVPVDRAWQRVSRGGRLPTIVALALDATHQPQELLAQFREAGGLLPVLAQGIRSVTLRDGSEHSVHWRPTIVPLRTSIVEIGRGQIDLITGRPTNLVVVRTGGAGPRVSAVFALGSRGMEMLPASVPTFWVTAPTRVFAGTGWCLNGKFEVDIGRTQLGLTEAHRAQNLRQAEVIGTAIGRAFAEIFDAAIDIPDAAPALLGLHHGVGADGFWCSVWDVLTSAVAATGSDGTSESTRETLIALTRRGVAYIDGRAVVPTRLAGGWEALTAPECVEFVASDALARPEIAEVASRWPWVAARHGPGTVIHPSIHQCLQALRPQWRLAALDLPALLDVNAGLVRPGVDDIAALAPIYSWLGPDTTALPKETVDATRQALRGLGMLTEAGTTRAATELLLPVLQPETRKAIRARGGVRADDDLGLLTDDQRLAVFAPSGRRLDAGWSANADVLLVYFEARRGRPPLGSPEEISGWMRDAETETARVGALSYLLEGLRSGQLAACLQAARLPWASSLEALTSSGLLLHLRADLHTLLFLRLFPERVGVQPTPVALAIPATLEDFEKVPPNPAAAGRTLKAIARWWSHDETRADVLEQWTDESYPSWLPASELARRLREGGSPDEVNEAWLLLLVLGLCSRLGRTGERTAVNFVTRLREGGWWDTMVAGPDAGEGGSDDDSAWIVGLTNWLTSAADYREYDHWLSLLPWIYQARRWLGPYQRTLRAPAMVLGDGAFEYLWLPGINPNLQGYDFDAPPLRQFVGVPGRFVLRELVRLGVVPRSERLEREVWVPRLAVRRFLSYLGLPLDETGDRNSDSSKIREFVIRHVGPDENFRGDYDLPLLIVALSPSLREAAIRGTLAPSSRPEEVAEDTPAEPEQS